MPRFSLKQVLVSTALVAVGLAYLAYAGAARARLTRIIPSRTPGPS